jgi:hypothetical protein
LKIALRRPSLVWLRHVFFCGFGRLIIEDGGWELKVSGVADITVGLSCTRSTPFTAVLINEGN